MKKTIVLFAIVLGLYADAYAGTTTLTGTIKDAQGNPLNGTLTMRLPFPAQDVDTNTAISPGPVTYNLVNGAIVGGPPLYDVGPTHMQPNGLYYIARAYDTQGFLQFAANYVVTGASFNLGAATPTAITTSNVSYVLPIFPNAVNSFTASQQFTTILSLSTPDAGTGFVRMANGDLECWRNASNSADVCMGDTAVSGLDYTYFSGSGGLIINSGFLTSAAGSAISIFSTPGAASAGPQVSIAAANATGTNLNGGGIVLQPGLKNGSGSNGSVLIQHGVNAGGSGFQHKRVISCTTGAGAGATCNTTITWATAFDDSNYTAVCTVGAPTGTPSVMNISSITATSEVVTITNNTAVASQGILECIGVHD